MTTITTTMIDGNTTMTTDPTTPDRREDRARKVARARALTDPLGAQGQRRSGQRVEREAAARRAVFVATLGAFVASFGLAAASDSGRSSAPTDMAIVGVGVSAAAVESAAARATRLAEAWEAAFSRFRPDSELSCLNGSGGRPTRVSVMFLEVLDAAIAAAVRSRGRFDPTVLPSLEAAGYDQTIERVRGQELSERSRPSVQAGAAGIGGIEMDRGQSAVTVAAGVRLDLGGIAKGAFADRITEELRDWPGGCVDAGGDLRVWGRPPSGPHWLVSVEDPWRPGSDLLVAAIAGPSAAGVASSSVTRRRWIVDSVPAHHLLDPRTGQPLGGAALAATALQLGVWRPTTDRSLR